MRLSDLIGVDRQREQLGRNTRQFIEGMPANHALLWGARGMGKSALVRSATVAAQASGPTRLALVQVAADALPGLPALLALLGERQRNFLVYLDDLGFADGDKHHVCAAIGQHHAVRFVGQRATVQSSEALKQRFHAEVKPPVVARGFCHCYKVVQCSGGMPHHAC